MVKISKMTPPTGEVKDKPLVTKGISIPNFGEKTSPGSTEDGVAVRATKKRSEPLPESENGGEDVDVGQVSHTGEAVVKGVLKSTEEPNKKAALAEDIDGKKKHQRTNVEQRAVDSAIDEVTKDLKNKVTVQKVKAERRTKIRTKTGHLVETSLKRHQKSKVVKTVDNSEVLIVNKNLTDKEVAVETSNFIEKKIESATQKRGVRRVKNSKFRLRRRFKRQVWRFLRRTVIRPAYVDFKVSSLDETTAERLQEKTRKNDERINLKVYKTSI